MVHGGDLGRCFRPAAAKCKKDERDKNSTASMNAEQLCLVVLFLVLGKLQFCTGTRIQSFFYLECSIVNAGA